VSFAADSNANLSGQVIKALHKAFQPSIANCLLEWPKRMVRIAELYRFQNLTSYELMSPSEFEKLKVRFSGLHEDGSLLKHEFTRASFNETALPLF
jgi:hypothetical protein